MGEGLSRLRKMLPGNKFTPPCLNFSRQVERESLLQEITGGRWAKKKHILVQAKAGQGKTTLAAQLLQNVKLPHLWYQAGPEDLDPLVLLAAVSLLFHDSFADFSALQLEERMLRGAIPPQKVSSLAGQLMAEVGAAETGPVFLVFDDLHHVKGSEESCVFLAELIKTAPDNLRFMLLSRYRVPVLFETLESSSRVLSLSEQDISLSRQETYSLCSQVFGIPLSPGEVAAIHEVTEGWVAGILLWAQSGDLRTVRRGLQFKEPKKHPGLFSYFFQNLLASLRLEERSLLFYLALLTEIPVALAEYLGEEFDILALLDSLVEQNSFVRYYSSDEPEGAYRFHNLFHQALGCMASQAISSEEKAQFLRRVAVWYLDQGCPLVGLQYLLDAEDYQAAEDILRHLGFQLISHNFHATLSNLLAPLAEELLDDFSWLALIYGIVLMEGAPQKAFGYLKSANERLRQAGDPQGELYSLIQLITYHLAVDARYCQGSQMLVQAEKLFQVLFDDMDVYARAQIAPVIGLGHCVFDANLEAARRYAEISASLGGAGLMARFVMLNYTLRSYIHFFAGNPRGCQQEIERSLDLLRSTLVNPVFKSYLWFFQLNFLSLSGDFVNYQYHKNMPSRGWKAEYISSVMLGSIIPLWDMDQALAEGRYGDVLRLAEGIQGQGFAASSPHLSSQYYHYGAYVLALKGDREKAEEWAARSKALSISSGGRFYMALNNMFLGATCTVIGEAERAESFLQNAVAAFRHIGNDWMLSGALAYRAFFYLQQGQMGAVLVDIREMLRYLRNKHCEHFYGWDPQVMKTLLALAVKKRIEPEFCRELARNRMRVAISDQGEVFPCLIIRALGPLELAFDTSSPLLAPSFSETHRRLFAMLISAHSKQLRHEFVQDLLWPESDTEKGRKSFDTSLFRLRKIVSALLGDLPSQNFIQLQAGILCLKNCWVDVDEFRQRAHKGLKHFQVGEYWQAGNAFARACSLWRGDFVANTGLDETEEHHRRELLSLFQDISLKWAGLLCRDGMVNEAVTIAEKALREDTTFEPLVRMLFHCHIQKNNPVRAGRVLKSYEEALRKQDYLPEDIDDILESFWQ